MWQTAAWLTLAVALAVAWQEASRPELLIVGSLTEDIIDGHRYTGGAVAYAAAVASLLGARACVVTAAAAGPNSALLPSSVLEGHDVTVVPSNATLTFQHIYTYWGNKRRLRVLDYANVSLSWKHVPRRCRAASTVLLCPLTPNDVDVASFLTYNKSSLARLLPGRSSPRVGLLAQGLQRRLAADGQVAALHKPSDALLQSLSPHVLVFLSDVETEVWLAGAIDAVAARCERVLVTRGADGAYEVTAGSGGTSARIVHHPAVPLTEAVDTNGAGDSFAAGFMLAAARGHSAPAAAANWAGALAAMQPQACKPGCIRDASLSSSVPPVK